jgi:hypothetical protein
MPGRRLSKVAIDDARRRAPLGRHPLAAGRGAGGYRGGKQWEEEMRSGLLLTTLIGLAGASHVSSAADATWVAFSQSSNRAECYGPQLTGATWQVDIRGSTLTFSTQAVMPRSFTVDLKGLQPDGSGKVVFNDAQNREWYVTFDPGSGARPFHVTSAITPCAGVFLRPRHSDVSWRAADAVGTRCGRMPSTPSN